MKRRMITVRNLVLHILLLLIIFVGAILVFERLINQVTPDVAGTMANSTFPLVYMERNGVKFNCLHGYSREMDVSFLRDSITPLDSDHQLDICIQTFSTSIDGVTYEVMALDGSSTLENTKVVKLVQDGDEVKATLALQNKMLMNQEYMLKLQVNSGGRNIYYYTHVLLADGLHTTDYLNYVSGFYDKCINKTDLNTIGAAVEPDATTDEEATLAFMDIHDSVQQLTWSSLNPQIYYKPTPKLTEINGNTATLTLEYRIASVNDSGITEVYNVFEYYRVRYTDSRVFLLNFERTTDEVFNPSNNVLGELGIHLGITGKQVNFASDSRNRVIAFVQEEELWSYDISNAKLTQIFSFPQKENMDYRDFYGQNDIRILRVNSNGDIWFTVTGYMNRGTHEGDNGVALYYYEAASAMVDEKIFLNSMESVPLLTRDVNQLAYVSENRAKFCVLLDGTVYQVDLNSRGYDVKVENAANNCFAAAASGRYFAWLKEGLEYDSETLCLMDMETGNTREITCAVNERIRPICFMNDDLVYGVAYQADTKEMHGGNGIFPMYKLIIEDAEGNQIKHYEPNGYYVTKVVQADNMLTLSRVTKTDGKFTEGMEDHIVNTDTETSVALGVATKKSSKKQTEVILRVGTTLQTRNPQVVRSKILTYETSRSMEIPTGYDHRELYYVYAGGKLSSVCTYANEAIVRADEKLGVAIDGKQNYIWVRGDKDGSIELNMAKLPPIVTSGTMDMQELEEGIGKKVIDLTGCTLDEVLYFVSHGKPVIAMTEEGPKTIVGYDEYNTYLVDPKGTEWYYKGINDSTELFEKAGNVFVSYLDEEV